ncbi:DNA cytosine methyltransferase [Vreelandella venusta]
MIEAVDLFCGAGGLTAGLRKAGINVRAGYDIEETCRFAYENNNQAQFINQDVSNLTGDDINSWFPNSNSIRLLAGCAPCQPFSTYNQGKDTTKDKKWPLLGIFSRLIHESQPELVTMENVPAVTKHKIYHEFIESLKNNGYYIWADTIACTKYGLPQNRRRHVLLASKLGKIELIPETHEAPISVKETIGNLEPVAAGIDNPNDPLHKAASLSEINMQRIRHSLPGGSWRDWPKSLVAKCHLKPSGKTYSSVYGRMRWEEPSPTMTTNCYGFGNGRFGHPDQDRAITLREAAMLQSFPKDYVFTPPKQPIHFSTIGKMIGNAVPVRLGEVIGISFIRHLENL